MGWVIFWAILFIADNFLILKAREKQP